MYMFVTDNPSKEDLAFCSRSHVATDDILGDKLYPEPYGSSQPTEITLTKEEAEEIIDVIHEGFFRWMGLRERMARAKSPFDLYSTWLDLLQGNDDMCPIDREVAPGIWLRALDQHAEPVPAAMALCTKPYEERAQDGSDVLSGFYWRALEEMAESQRLVNKGKDSETNE